MSRIVDAFEPARDKLEAVTRIGRLTGTSQNLGPGSKERKAALVAISMTLGLSVPSSLNKPAYAGELARQLGVSWGKDCYSTGQTITLTGLNRLLEPLQAARYEAGPRDVTATQEAAEILRVASAALSGRWTGSGAITQMRDAGSTQWAQDEWAGFYFEFLVLTPLIAQLGGGPTKICNTRFDYQRRYTWDLKWHGAAARGAPLNDAQATDEAVSTGGVGFVVLTGRVEYDDGAFRTWQKQYRADHGRVPAPRTRPLSYTRKSKKAFTPHKIEAFFVADEAALAAALHARALGRMSQGRQVSGAARGGKYSIDLPRARDQLLVAERTL